MKISNVEVSHTSEHSDYALSWETTEGKFHIWLVPNQSHPDGYEVRNILGNKTAQLYKTVGAKVRYLKLDIGKNKAMFEAAMAEALAGGLFLKADAALLEAEQKRLAHAAAEYKVTLAKEAGPKMLRVLKAIAEFWKAEQSSFPLAPGAMIFDDGDQLIADAVREAVTEAEGRK